MPLLFLAEDYVKVLLKNGAKVDAQMYNRKTSLHLAAESSERICEKLWKIFDIEIFLKQIHIKNLKNRQIFNITKIILNRII